MRRGITYILLFVPLLFSGCKKQVPDLKPEIVQQAEIYQTGYSTWYGPGFHGRLTATGEVYNMYSYTAAHRTLPLNSIIRVQNVKNGRWTVVRINDRGPVRKTLILDLSKLAAMELDLTRKGSAKVQIQVLSTSRNPLKKIFDVYINLNKQLPNSK